MTRRKRKPSKSRRWLWILAGALGAAAAYLAYHRPGSHLIPVPGQTGQSLGKSPTPSEQIDDADRENLERLLREHTRRR
jgi:hypothetical protein